MTAGVVFVTRFDRVGGGSAGLSAVLGNIFPAVEALRAEGWKTSVRESVRGTGEPAVYDMGPYHEPGFFGCFEAPSLEAALLGVGRLMTSGWRGLGRTEWFIGSRDLPPVPSRRRSRNVLGFLALWRWNDAWHAASAAERAAYDADCDVAFRFDSEQGVDQVGRFAMSVTSGWDHAALWELPDLETLATCMFAHERARDFMFTTSRHYVGKARRLTSWRDG